MNWRKALYFAAHRAFGSRLPQVYQQYQADDRSRAHAEIAHELLSQILIHSATSVPYYRALFAQRGISLPGGQDALIEDPASVLAQLPILTKRLIRAHTDDLTSADLAQRKWYRNSSGGSTGVPITFIQDSDHKTRAIAIQSLYSAWVSAEVGERQVHIWGSPEEVARGHVNLPIMLANWLTDRTLLNAYFMSPERMRAFIATLNAKRPKLIVAYAQAIYELAQFAQREGLPIARQTAIISTADTLYPFMRETLEQVFGCPVYNRYGSREVGDVAGECHEHQGLHVLPWGSYVEIVDDEGAPVPPGVEGRILVTNLTNYAMPLLRYDIGDRGALAPTNTCPCGRRGQLLLHLAGRESDIFKASDGTLIEGGYFADLLESRPWVQKFQVVQESLDAVRYKVMLSGGQSCPPEDMAAITEKTRAALGPACQVHFAFVDDIPQLTSGKYRYTLSLVTGDPSPVPDRGKQSVPAGE